MKKKNDTDTQDDRWKTVTNAILRMNKRMRHLEKILRVAVKQNG